MGDSTKLIGGIIEKNVALHKNILSDKGIIAAIALIADRIIAAFAHGNKVLLCGNGGSAADAQHLAAEFSGRFYIDRKPLDAEALHVNTSYLTAVGNDYSFDDIFARLVTTKGKSGDILIGISTSGNSANVIKALQTANQAHMITIGLTGSRLSAMDACPTGSHRKLYERIEKLKRMWIKCLGAINKRLKSFSICTINTKSGIL
jgi:D-sedoheptulose 7-phosphate isomerase